MDSRAEHRGQRKELVNLKINQWKGANLNREKID